MYSCASVARKCVYCMQHISPNYQKSTTKSLFVDVYLITKARCIGGSSGQSGEDPGCADGAGFQDQRGGGSRSAVRPGLSPGRGPFTQTAGEPHNHHHAHHQTAQRGHTGMPVGKWWTFVDKI